MKLISTFADLTKWLIQICFPPYCCHCGKFGSLLCFYCYDSIIFDTSELKSELTIVSKQTDSANLFDSVKVVGPFDGVLKSLIIEYKYKFIKEVSEILSELMWLHLDFSTDDSWRPIITFVPVHQSKVAMRGFNQSKLLAEQLAKASGIPMADFLIKTKPTKAQATQNQRARIDGLSVTTSIKLNEKNWQTYLKKHQAPTHIFLIDDVITTGSTISHCARLLKNNTDATVIVRALAHGK